MPLEIKLFAAFLKATREVNQRQLDCIADCLEFEHVYSSLALFIFANACLSHAQDFGKLCLSQFSLNSNTPKQSEEYFSITLSLDRNSSNPLHVRSIGSG